MASMDLKDDRTKIKSTDLNEFIVRGGDFSYKSIKQSTSTVLIATIFFFYFSNPLPLGSLLSFILHLFLHLHLTRGQLMVYANICLISLFQKSLGVVVRLKKYCSEITSSLMRPKNQLQSIQCGGNSFPLDICGFPSFLYVQGTRPYHQSFLEGHFDHQDLYLICVQLIRGDIPPRTTFPFVSCSLSPESEPFITICLSSDYSRPRPRPKAQYMI